MELRKHGFLFLFAVFAAIAVLAACTPKSGEDAPFQFQEDETGIFLTENGDHVFYYREAPKTLTGEYVCNHYIHPLYALNGDTLTEEFPLDHPYHRGIFWSWHQFYMDSTSLGDEWIMENISHEVAGIQTGSDPSGATLELDVMWRSTLLENGKAFMKEKTRITVHPLQKGVRKIDFEISLQALVPNLSMGGSDDEKGYGGFCARIKLPDDLKFISSTGAVEPKTLQVRAGSWMDFTGTFGKSAASSGTSGTSAGASETSAGASGKSAEQSGVAICTHPSTPNFPAPWILRQKSSMQNIVFPGRERVGISMDKPTILRYRLIVHEGATGDHDMARLQAEFEETVF